MATRTARAQQVKMSGLPSWTLGDQISARRRAVRGSALSMTMAVGGAEQNRNSLELALMSYLGQLIHSRR